MDKKQAGKLGGQKWTLAKANAARVNGAQGGRPRTRTLAQVLRADGMALQAAYYKLAPRQRGKLQRYFGLPKTFVNFHFMATRPAAKLTKGVRDAVIELRRMARTTK
jgi:hypothetical protein